MDPPRLWNRDGFVLTWHLRELTPERVTRAGGTTSIEYSGSFTFADGFALLQLAGQLDWRFEATVSRDAPGGYAFGLEGGFSPESDPTPVGDRSWGGIKAIYR